MQQSSTVGGQEFCWVEKGDRMGCKADCKCGVLEQCYPKFVSVVGLGGSTHHRMENVGVCGIAMPVLVFLSGVVFIGLLSCVVMARMYFQWRESQLLEGSESADRPKSLLLPSTTNPAFPPAEKANAGLQTVVAWPEAEPVSG